MDALDRQAWHVRCPICGSFDVENDAIQELEQDAKQDPKHCSNWLLSAWTRNHSGERLDPAKVEKLRASLLAPSLDWKLANLLRLLASRSEHPGRTVAVLDTDTSLLWCANVFELQFLEETLVERGFFEGQKVTAKGWDELTSSRANVVVDQIFVAMWFDSKVDHVWEGIKSGVSAAGYQALRMDKLQHAERIDLRMLGEIRSSVAMVADASGARPNVFYEAGFAEALKIPVIWTIAEVEAEQAPFDTRQFRHIRWRDTTDLAAQLEQTICGILGRRESKRST